MMLSQPHSGLLLGKKLGACVGGCSEDGEGSGGTLDLSDSSQSHVSLGLHASLHSSVSLPATFFQRWTLTHRWLLLPNARPSLHFFQHLFAFTKHVSRNMGKNEQTQGESWKLCTGFAAHPRSIAQRALRLCGRGGYIFLVSL